MIAFTKKGIKKKMLSMIFQDFDAIMALFMSVGIGILIGAAVVGLVLYALCLMLSLKIVDGGKREFGTVFVTGLLSGLVGGVPCVGCFLSAYIINTRHDITYGKGLLAWIIAMLIPGIISAIAAFALGGFAAIMDAF